MLRRLKNSLRVQPAAAMEEQFRTQRKNEAVLWKKPKEADGN